MIRILLADDHALVRGGLKQLFALVTDITVAAEANNGAQVLDALHRERFDLLLLDMTMPGISGPDLVHRIRARDGYLPILVLSMHNEAQVVKRALAAGVSGYLTKDNDPAVLFAAVRKVAGGGRFIEPRLAEAVAFDSGLSGSGEPHSCLSDREFQILCLLAKGSTVNEAANELLISNKTVSTHKARMMEKMGFASSADLVKYAMQHGLAE